MFSSYVLILILVSSNSGYTEAGLIVSPNQESKDSAINSNGPTAKSESGKEIDKCNAELLRKGTGDDSNTKNPSGKKLQEPISQSKARLLGAIGSMLGLHVISTLGGSITFVYFSGTCCADGGIDCCIGESVASSCYEGDCSWQTSSYGPAVGMPGWRRRCGL
ncbi:unnamed protein product [Nezara viridula]|uniref:Neuropeptide n=1 Tax=Nezara viridula TaxID=85310 RepID=A0A9P0HGR4_NEZVI|nr:unnamed protein product [Nezara viridula]